MKPECSIRFHPGRIVATPGALEAFTDEQISTCIRRHLGGDWGDLCEEDKDLNEQAVVSDCRIMSSYVFPDDKKLWIITEADRSSTTLLLPEEY